VNTDATKCLWAGDAAGDHWELRLTSIYEGPFAYPDDGEIVDGKEFIEGSHAHVWKLLLLSRSGTRMEAWWDPARRILGGVQLRGWSKPTIGALKRHLIELGERP